MSALFDSAVELLRRFQESPPKKPRKHESHLSLKLRNKITPQGYHIYVSARYGFNGQIEFTIELHTRTLAFFDVLILSSVDDAVMRINAFISGAASIRRQTDMHYQVIDVQAH